MPVEACIAANAYSGVPMPEYDVLKVTSRWRPNTASPSTARARRTAAGHQAKAYRDEVFLSGITSSSRHRQCHNENKASVVRAARAENRTRHAHVGRTYVRLARAVDRTRHAHGRALDRRASNTVPTDGGAPAAPGARLLSGTSHSAAAGRAAIRRRRCTAREAREGCGDDMSMGPGSGGGAWGRL